MPKILYWSGISRANLELFYRCEDKINLLLSGYTKSADLDLKKAHGHRLYTIRLNQSDRLLFTTLINEGKSYLLLLELIENHDYQKSRFLKPDVLRRYLIDKDRDVAEVINLEDFETIGRLDGDFNQAQASEVTAAAASGLKYEKVTYYNQQFITLDTTQLIASDSQLPMIVSGPPGSGKSCVALSLISKEVSKRAVDDVREIVCVTMSRRLSHHLQAQWQELPEARDEAGNLLGWVQFITYNQLLVRQPFAIIEEQLAERAYFNEWFANYKKELTDKIKLLDEPLKQAASELIASNLDKIFQELCIIAVDPTEYLDLGMRQSLFYGKDEREILLAAYQMYCRCLIANNRVCPFLYQPEIREPLFGCVIVDEAQDFSLGQLLVLGKLTDNVNIAFSLDSHQSLLASKSIRPRLVQKLTQLAQAQRLHVTEIALRDTYRCPAVVAKLANQVLAIKNHITGGVGDKEEIAQIMPSTKAGYVYWQDCIPDSRAALTGYFKRLQHELNVNEAQIAIITPQELIETVQSVTEHPLVFSPTDIKGLEYSGIIAWSPLDHPDVVEANKYLPDEGEELKVSTHRSKDKESHLDGLAPVLNGVFVTFTRALAGLLVLQPYSHNKRRVIGHLKQGLSSSRPEERPQLDIREISTRAPVASKADWEKECMRLWQNDNLAQARKIYEHYLAEDGRTLEQYIEEYIQERDGRVITAAQTISGSAEKEKEATTAKQKIAKAQVVPARELTASEPIIYPPLSTKLSNWIEGLFKVISHKSNLLLLLKHEKLIPILFHHKMANGQCLFVNICFFADMNLFLSNLQGVKRTAPKEVNCFIQALTASYDIATQTQDVHLKLLLGLVSFAPIINESDRSSTVPSIPPLSKILEDIRAQQFGALFSADDKSQNICNAMAKFIMANWAKVSSFLTQEDIISQKLSNNGKIGASFLFTLIANSEIDFISTHWAIFSPALMRHLRAVVTCEGNYQGTSLFYWLCSTPEGKKLLAMQWNYFKKLTNSEMLNTAVTTNGPTQGVTPFLCLCAMTEGRQLINTHWADFRVLINKDMLRAQVTGDNGLPGKGTSPFYFLCGNPDGRELIARYWVFFKNMIDKEMLRAQVTDGEDRGKSPAYCLLATRHGRELLIYRHWDYFSQLLDKAILSAQITGHGGAQGTSPFYSLCYSEEGSEFIAAHWDFFKQFVQDDNILHAKVTGSFPDKGSSAFYWLCKVPRGQQLIVDHWDEFKMHIDRTALHFPFIEKNHREDKSLLQRILSLLTNKIVLDEVTVHSIIKKAFIYEHDKKFIDDFYIKCLTYYRDTLTAQTANRFYSYLFSPVTSQPRLLDATTSAIDALLEAINNPREARFEENQVSFLKDVKCWGIISAYASARNTTADKLLTELSQSPGLTATQSRTKTATLLGQSAIDRVGVDEQCSLDAIIDKKPDIYKPLSAELSNWVENIIKVIHSKTKILDLLKHEQLTPILFQHKMTNGHCLFVNICASANVSLFISNLKALKQSAPIEIQNFIKSLNVAYAIAKQTSDTHLKLFLGLVKF
jgi:hypothetical protein